MIGLQRGGLPAGITLLFVRCGRVACWNTLSGGDHWRPRTSRSAPTPYASRCRVGRAGWRSGVVSRRHSVPAGDHLARRPCRPGFGAHFVASFWLSGLIALAYSLCGVQYVVVRVLYPGMWRNVRGFTETARRELAPVTKQLNRVQLIAGSIPLFAAIVMLILGDTANFRLLVTGLILLGMAGFYVANGVTRELSQVVVTLTGARS